MDLRGGRWAYIWWRYQGISVSACGGTVVPSGGSKRVRVDVRTAELVGGEVTSGSPH